MTDQITITAPVAEEPSASSKATRWQIPAQFEGRTLLVVRALWWLLIAVIIVLFLAGIQANLAYLRSTCVAPSNSCFYHQLTPAQANVLLGLGYSQEQFALYFTTLNAILALVFLVTGIVIFVRKSSEPMAVYTALMLVTFGPTSFIDTLSIYAIVQPALWLPIQILVFVGAVTWLVFFYIFPSGNFIPRATRYLALAWAILEFGEIFLGRSRLDLVVNLPRLVPAIIFSLFFASGFVAQLYRYRYISSRVQRQQTKWFVYGATVSLIGIISIVFLGAIAPEEDSYLLLYIIANTILYLFILLFPISIGLAILRSRLWDIDFIINRTLIYLPLSAILAGLFAVASTLTQKLFSAFHGQAGETGAVLTTLIVVAAFDPIRKQVTKFVDANFKEAPQPGKQLDAFGERVYGVFETVDSRRLSQSFLDQAVTAFHARGGALYIGSETETSPEFTSGVWEGEGPLHVPLKSNETQVGTLVLGPRDGGHAYSKSDKAVLERNAERVARALTWSGKLGEPQK